jgi:hypothetical protein
MVDDVCGALMPVLQPGFGFREVLIGGESLALKKARF